MQISIAFVQVKYQDYLAKSSNPKSFSKMPNLGKIPRSGDTKDDAKGVVIDQS